MARNDKGFTLIELMITVACLMLILLGAMTLFADVVRYYKQEGKLAESGVERLIGLELLRQDIEAAGYGLPWNLPAGFIYDEAASGTLNDAPSNRPRGILCDDDGGLYGSDRLVIKSAAVGMAAPSRQWTLLSSTGTPRPWDPPTENLTNGDRVIVLAPGSTEDGWRTLVTSAGVFDPPFAAAMPAFASPVAGETRVVYGIDNGASLRMPFNRAEYAIDTSSVPSHCAPNTGVLVKRLVLHASGNLGAPLPLLDCVAGMEIEFERDVNGDGDPEATIDGGVLSTLDATTIRQQVKEVRVYILAQEGQRDEKYTHPAATIDVRGQNVNVDRKYRWRVHALAVKMINLGG